MRKSVLTALLLCAGCLTACNSQSSAPESTEMQYIKTSVFYDTVMDMYQNPDNYLGKQYHMVGTLYEIEDDETGEVFRSIYGTSPTDRGEGIGIELRWDNFEGIAADDKITVEGTLDSEKGTHDGEEREFLILRVSMLEKRE